MKNSVIKKLIFLLFVACSATAQDGKFTFNLPVASTTSAGVYKTDGTLIRTLWSNEKLSGGSHSKSWDGNTDAGIKASSLLSYQVKVVSHNISYSWQGTIGNNSDSLTGAAKHRGYYRCMSGLAFGPTYGYFCMGYSEGTPSLAKFNIANPRVKIPIYGNINTGDINYVTTDGNYVYWGGFDPNAAIGSFVFATRVADDTEVKFTAGSIFNSTFGRDYPYAISIMSQSNALISGMAVQKTGNYLFVARAGINQVQVINKATGSVIHSLSYNSPKGLSTDGRDDLWMITGKDSVMKYTVNVDGTLSSPVLKLFGVEEPLSTQVSPDGTQVSVTDGGQSQQVKSYNNVTGSAIKTMGTVGGYLQSPAVADNKFYFSDVNGTGTGQYTKTAFIAYQADGSFWVNDPGNSRVQHFTQAGAYSDYLMWLGSTYFVGVDKNNINRVFSDFLEFEIDYNVQKLTGKTGWKLKNNWGASVNSVTYHRFPKHITTLSNGRTYGLIRKTNDWEVIEFPAEGKIRFTGIIFLGLTKLLCSDGSLQDYTLVGTKATYRRYPLIGFTSAGNPQWSTVPELLATAPIDNIEGNPVNFPNSQVFSTTTNKIALYNHKAWANNAGPVFSTGYHMGIMEKGADDKWLVKSEKSTHRNYQGEYPQPGFFDCGNMVNDFAGSNLNIIDRQIITGYHGEFWKNGQTNKYNHYFDNGLPLGQFGTTRYDIGAHIPAAPMMAGNALSPTLVKDAVGDLYLWHGDESDHSAIHRWKITNVSSVLEQILNVPYPAAFVAPQHNFENLMVDLPFDATLVTNTAGWTRYPLIDSVVNKFTDNWSVITSAMKYEKGVDLFMRFSQPTAQTFNVSRDLGADSVKNDWKITGNVILVCSGGTLNGQGNNAYIDVLDYSGKILTTFYGAKDLSLYPTVISKVFGNSNQMLSMSGSGIVDKEQNFEIIVNKGVVTFKYGSYSTTTTLMDATGNWRRPKTLRFRFVSKVSTQNYNVRFDVSDLKLYKDVALVPTTNKPPVAFAGPDQVVNLPVTTTNLEGSGTDSDGNVVSYSWTKLSGPSSGFLASPGTAVSGVVIAIPGVYKYQLTVTDNEGAMGRDTIVVTLNAAQNIPPVANAGADQAITLPSNNTTLTGIGTDSDGFIVSYEWAKISGPTGGLPSPTNTNATVITGLTTGTYQYLFSVKDDAGAITRDTVVITVYPAGNQAPVAHAGMDIAITLPVNNITVTGTASDADGTISSFAWSQLSGPSIAFIASPNAASSLISNLVEGAYEYVLTVKDDLGAVSNDTIRITVNSVSNLTPTAIAGADVVISQPATTATLAGSGIDLDGTIATYRWMLLTGPTVAGIVSPASAVTTINNLGVGVYEFELQVKDNKGAISSDTVQVMVLGVGNQAPKADAGLTQTFNLPVNVTTLTGEGIDDDGSVVAYLWKKISGPAAGSIAYPTAASTAITDLIAGTYTFELTVTDNKGAIGKATVVIIVNPAINLKPVANAGADQAIRLPQNSVTLTGSSTDTDGTIVLVSWKQVSGPVGSTIAQPGQLASAVTNLGQGVYEFELSVTDNAGATAKDTMQLTVSSIGNKLPVAIAGNDQDLNLPLNSVTLSGAGTDMDGTIIAFSWRKISGADHGLILNPNSVTTLVTNLEIGSYLYELTVTDNMGGVASDTLKVTVNAAVNWAPIANAGADLTITLPVNSTTLAGMGTDVDGTIATYAWTKLSGPVTGVAASPNTALTLLNNLVAGTYTYLLTVTDNAGAIGKDTVVITVEAAPNQAPRVDAGANIVINLPLDSTFLNGSAVDEDGTIASYSWTMISGAVGAGLKNARQAIATAYALKAGQYIFELTVTDDDGAVSVDTVQVTVNGANNLAPVANAGVDIFISLPSNATLFNGTATDADGTIASYSWIKLSGPAAGSLTLQNTANASITGLVQGVYSFELTVTDNLGAVSKDVVNVTVNAPENQVPVANAGADQVVQLPVNTATLTGTGVDTDGTIANYTWAKIDGPASGNITSPTAASTILTNLVEGVYHYQLIIRDNSGATARDTIQVTVSSAPNMAPVANAGPDQTIALPKSDVTLSGDATDIDGTITSYAWRKISGPATGSIASPGSGITSVTALVQGVYKFEFTVKDDKGATTRDTIQVTVIGVQNELPTADAGKDQDIVLPANTTTLAGNANDLDGFITTYLWRKISGPSSGTIATPSSATSAVNSLVKGVYFFEFTVTDNAGAVAKDTIRVSVNDFNFAPVANAGTDQTITLPASSASLTGSATDVDGTIVNYAWVKISGPTEGTIVTPGAAATDVNALVQGLYEFELTVTDDDGAIAKDTIQVTVNDLTNMAPVANAGPNRTITLPVTTTTLSGSGTDADGTVVSYSWVMISGPAAPSIVTPNAAVTTINNLAYGTYKFELTVTDDKGAISKDVVEVLVTSLTNVPPIANAGPDQFIISPKNNTILHGTGTDPDGTVTRYSWTKISGPQGTITSPNSADPTLKNLVPGVYVYQLTVRDNDGATSTDLVQITVGTPTPANNIAPVANAGTNKSITLPVNTTMLNGSATDTDGTISSYAWTKLSGPAAGTITSPASGTTAVSGLEEGVYQFVLTVKDNLGAIGKDTVQVTVIAIPNQAPLADAGMDQSISLPVNYTTLYGIGIDPDGTISSYDWKIISGPGTGNIFSQGSATTAAGNLVQGVYAFELTVTDNNGGTGKDTLVLTVFPPDNKTPVANAGSARVINLPINSVTLNGTGTDEDGTIVSYGWIQLSGPSIGTIAAGNAPEVTITNLVEGTYQFELTVTDNDGAISKDIVEVTVTPAVNQAPVANAGADKTITLPVDNTSLEGLGTDADGTVAGYKWTRISGPAAGIIGAPNEATSTLTNLVEGVYQYQLTVTDNNGDASKDTMTVTVLSAPNLAPVADAGTDK
ncbi:MAG: tandem-95 repeat protein, partial [Ferruginibacter sp.]|nr:tandem-95 repeat protein [Ferruginibacter sp.]